MAKPYAFSFWQSSQPAPTYIELCAKTRDRNLPLSFQPVHLDFDSCIDWVPERDELWQMSEPFSEGRSYSQESRRWALFCGFLRIALIHRHGGIWIDADTIVFQQFSLLASLVEDFDLVAPEYNGQRIANSVIGGKPNSEYFKLHWQHIKNRIQKKRETSELKAHWGEYGHRMIREIFVNNVNVKAFILPFGMLIPFDTEAQFPAFDTELQLQDYLPITAVGLSFYNSSMPDLIRQKTANQLLAESTIFSQAYQLATSDDSNYLPLSAATQLIPYNRAIQLRESLTKTDQYKQDLVELKTKLVRRNEKIQSLKANIQKIES